MITDIHTSNNAILLPEAEDEKLVSATYEAIKNDDNSYWTSCRFFFWAIPSLMKNFVITSFILSVAGCFVPSLMPLALCSQFLWALYSYNKYLEKSYTNSIALFISLVSYFLLLLVCTAIIIAPVLVTVFELLFVLSINFIMIRSSLKEIFTDEDRMYKMKQDLVKKLDSDTDLTDSDREKSVVLFITADPRNFDAIRTIYKMLRKAGYNIHPILGDIGDSTPDTRKALREKILEKCTAVKADLLMIYEHGNPTSIGNLIDQKDTDGLQLVDRPIPIILNSCSTAGNSKIVLTGSVAWKVAHKNHGSKVFAPVGNTMGAQITEEGIVTFYSGFIKQEHYMLCVKPPGGSPFSMDHQNDTWITRANSKIMSCLEYLM